MANVLDKNPLLVDTTGEIKADNVQIHSIIVYPTAASWVVKLNNGTGGPVIFEVLGATEDSYQYLFPAEYRKPVWATTLTNCRLLIYTR